MASATVLKPDQYEKIITSRLVFGRTSRQTAEALNVGVASVNRVEGAFKAVQAGEWDKVVKMVEDASCPFAMIEWAAHKLDVEIPQAVQDARERRYEPKQKQSVEKPPEPVPLPDHWEDEKRFLQAMIAEQQKTNELLEQLFDVVFPKWAGDVKDNLNVNCDLINQTLKRIEDKTEAIKINVRRKGM